MFDKKFMVISGVSTAVAAVVYVLWGPSQRKSSKVLCRGLENLGNTCFLNAVLQAWASTPCLLSWLRDFLTRKTDNSPTLAQPLYNTLKVINYEEDDNDDVHAPADIIGALRSHRWVISHDEQDAHELFNALTSTLDEESMKFPSMLPLFDVKSLEDPDNKYQSPEEALTRSGGLLPVLPRRDLDNPFRMLVASQLECVDCKYRHPVRYDLSDSLSLSFPKNAWASIKLEVLLQRFITSEIVQDVECPGCKKIQNQRLKDLVAAGNTTFPIFDENPKTSCLKRLTIGRLPQCLCLQMNRTQWLDSGIPLKKFEHVVFPEILSMDEYVYTKCSKNDRNGLIGGRALFGNTSLPVPSSQSALSPTSGHINLLRALNYDSRISSQGLFLQSSPPLSSNQGVQPDINHNSPKSQEYSYKLTAVVCHLGDMFSGHFVTYRRSPKKRPGDKYSSKWLCTSDHAVKAVCLDEVLGSEAYMLFYERI